MKYNKSFTVLELLVVIAIIGILASVVLASVNGGRAKGADKAIVSNLQNARSEAQLYWSDMNGTFGSYLSDKCPSTLSATANVFEQSGNSHSVRLNKILAEANKDSGGSVDIATARYSNTRCAANGSNWAIAVALKSTPTSAWCVDSQGAAKKVTTTTPFTTTGALACL